MKNYYIYVIICALLNLEIIPTTNHHAISYDFSGGRFGDNIVSYANARYLSHITGIPFLYRPFTFSDQLNIDYDALSYSHHARRYPRTFHIGNPGTIMEFLLQIQNSALPPTLFIVDYFPIILSLGFKEYNLQNVLINIPWKDDEQFAKLLKKSLTPHIEIPDFRKADHLNVAVHVRVVGYSDGAHFPLKTPNPNYQKNQIRKVYELNLKRPMYVFLFSNTDKPLDLLHDFQNTFKDENIIFDIQLLDRPDLNNTIQDFFAMQKFDVLIATQSHLSMMAAYIGNFDMVILPLHFEGECPKENPNYIVDRVQIKSKKSEWFPYDLDIVVKD